jgi:L-aspartate oxidase
VELLVREAPACVQRLLELGMAFDRHGHELSTTLEAAHSHRRVLHAQDRTGRALVEVLEQEVRRRPGVVLRQGLLALQLWMEAGTCVGLQVLDGNRIHWLRARAVVLASGGGGHLFAHTTNPAQSCGDGVVMAWQAGALIRDLEFVQFHPTALMLPGAPHFLISEAVRGEGARLIDDHGQSPVGTLAGGDLAPRDQVSRALARCMQEQGVERLWLDLRPVGEARLEQQFPTILERCRALGLEPTLAPIPIAPAAHYWMGGVSTDLGAATTVPGLFAVGEVACTGVHGANRLASNSLMECLVFARQLRHVVLPETQGRAPWAMAGEGVEASLHTSSLPALGELKQQISALREHCWLAAGVERQGHHLQAELTRVRRERQSLEQLTCWHDIQHLPANGVLELAVENLARVLRLQELHQRLVLAELLMEAALFRCESRGGHFRTDAPSSQPFWQRHTGQRRGSAISTVPLAH